ncbi:unnamed protein product [Durusdinium trenchii]|uniref:Uncharacterized protein n=1 Tax=Durusdinium trenchii TaxID=1381693 RepID=A0ABP0JMV8_9DINO
MAQHLVCPGLHIRNRTRWPWAVLPLLLTRAAAYEVQASPSSLSVLEAKLVNLKKESAELHGPPFREAPRGKSKNKIGAVRSLEAQLSSENQRLRQQLRRTSERSEDTAVASRGGAGDQKVSLLSLNGVHGEPSFALLMRLLLIFGVVNTAIYLAWSAEGPVVEKVKRRAAEPLLRALGRGTYEVEISELQVTNLPANGSVVLALDVGGRRFTCEAACVQGLARFQDHFRFPIQGGGSEGQTCALRACQGEETIAEVALTTKDIMRRVHSKHGQQYFHYRMFPKEQHSAWRPSLALRLREAPTSAR